MTRLEANEQIIRQIQGYIRTYPDMRFGQVLYNMGVATHCATTELTEKGLELVEKGLGDTLQSTHFIHSNRDIFFEESTDTLNKIQTTFRTTDDDVKTEI